MESIYAYDDYKKYLTGWFSTTKQKKTDVAKEIGIQSSFLSQVLNGAKNLTLEQGIKFCMMLKFDEDMTDYFLLLIQRQKNSESSLEPVFDRQINNIRKKYGDYEIALNSTKHNDKNFYQFTSRWYYCAIHCLLGLRDINTIDDLTKKINLKKNLIEEAVAALKEWGYVQESAKGFQTIEDKDFLVFESGPNLTDYHHTWRIQALKGLNAESDTHSLHATNLLRVNDDTALKIRNMLLEANKKAYEIATNENMLMASSEEVSLYALCNDLFRVDNV